MSERIVIVGNGISGITAARYVRKASSRPITIVSAESPFFVARTALMYAYMGSIRDADLEPYERAFWRKNDFELRQDYAMRVDAAEKRLHLASGDILSYDRLVLATGSTPRRLGVPGEYLPGVQGFYSMQDLRLMRENTDGISRAAVVGGGLIGVEVAEMLRSKGIEVVFLVRERSYMDYDLPAEESQMVARSIRAHGVDLRFGVELERVKEETGGRVAAVETSEGEFLDVAFVALTVGVEPRTGLAAASGIETGEGILVNRYFETSAPDIYAIGDCAEFREPLPNGGSIERLWYTGRRHGTTLASTLLGTRTAYDPGVFFNSAKFFDLEYQTYGNVSAVPTPETHSIVARDEVRNRMVRIEYHVGTKQVLGFNLLGVRYRHGVCAGWIREGRTLYDVLRNLEQANFDPEFSRTLNATVREQNARFADHSTVA